MWPGLRSVYFYQAFCISSNSETPVREDTITTISSSLIIHHRAHDVLTERCSLLRAINFGQSKFQMFLRAYCLLCVYQMLLD